MNFSVEITKVIGTEPPEDFELNEVAHKLAQMIARMMPVNRECLVSKEKTSTTEVKRYSVFVLTPAEMRGLVADIESKIRLKLPIVF